MAPRTYTEAVIGFDAREQFLASGEFWPPDRRRTYLLRPEVERPLSVDALVWPSVFHELPVPDCGGVAADLWDDLDEMRAALAERPPVAHRVVAVSWITDDATAKGGPRRSPRDAMPCALGAEWELLGHDVADGGCLSGLSNCGYSALERAELAPRWAPRLNAAHLLATVDDAFAFRRLADTRVSEHAPFFVYALRALRPSGR
jgi:hypothetical protein